MQTVSKILETILYGKMFEHSKPFVAVTQHGFMPQRSTVTNLFYFAQDVIEAIDANKQVDVIYTDFAKAFDKVDHEILLNKLKFFGFSVNFLKLLSSYLKHRKQYVVFNSCSSFHYVANSGVPQGSNLGPLLFLLFINDLPSNIIHSKHTLFADDMKIWAKVESVGDCRSLQKDIDAIHNWSINNHLFFNIGKCSVVTFTRRSESLNFDYKMNNIPLNRKTEIRDLGILFDQQLRFIAHINNIVSSAFKSLGFLLRNSLCFRDVESLFILYNSLVRSKLEYASVIWNPCYETHIKYIESVQKRFVRFAYFKKTGTY
jgi:hypothetical protein